MKRLIPLLAAAALLAACDQSDITGPPRNTERPQPGTAPAAVSLLTPGGWGPVRIGMSENRAVQAMGGAAPQSLPPADLDWRACHYIRPAQTPGVAMMIEAGVLTRIDIGEGARGVLTDTGLTLGATPDEVRAQYPARLEEEPHKYEGPPSMYLTWWNPRAEEGIRFVVGQSGRVEAIYVGGESIRYVEGCS
jgi:hypothetical protein